MTSAIGIDLGTVYSCVGVYQYGNIDILANVQGNRITPSVVAFTEVDRLVGDAAKNQMTLNPENTIYGKRKNYLMQIKIKFYDFTERRKASYRS